MALKFDFDWKTFLMQKGEKIGLGVGAAVLVLMAVFGLKGAFSVSPSANAENLNKKTANAQNLLRTNKPRDESQFKVDSELMNTAAALPPIPADEFREVASLYVPFAPVDAKRGDPKIEAPTDMVAMVALPQVKAYMLSEDKHDVMTLRGEGNKNQNANAQKNLMGSMGMMGMMMGGGAQMMGMMGGPGMRGGIGGGQPGVPMPGGAGMIGMPGGGAGGVRPRGQLQGQRSPLGSATKEQSPRSTIAGTEGPQKDYGWVPIDKLGDRNDVRLADKVLPLHMVIWEGSFPYRKQLENIKSALHSPTLSEAAHELQFAGFEVQRREINRDGTHSEWGECGPNGFWTNVLELARATGQRQAKEDPSLEPLILDGLVLALPEQFSERPYPQAKLKNLEETKKIIEERGTPVSVVQSSTPFDVNKANIFSHAGGNNQVGASGQGAGGATQPAGVKGGALGPGLLKGNTGALKPGAGDAKEPGLPVAPNAVKLAAGRAAGANATATQNANWEPPDYCLIRFFDCDAEPGKTYEYRFQIKLINPNKDREKEVAYKELATKPFVVSNWIELPQRVTIPLDFHYYAVNVKELAHEDLPDGGKDASAYKSGAYRLGRDDNSEVAMQLLRWVSQTDITGHSEPVGDWAVAEQVFFRRGEFVGGPHRIRMPVWSWLNEEFVIATHPKDRRQMTAQVSFTDSDSQSPVLVDFSGGTESYLKPDEIRKIIVKDDGLPRELLLLSPEGRLFVRNSAIDGADQKRKEHVDWWRERVKEILDRKSQKKPGDNRDNPSPFKTGGAKQ